MDKLRAWAESNKEIVVPHPKAALILDLLDHGMIEFATVPETGKIIFRAKAAKEEFRRFIVRLNHRYLHDERTLRALLCFAYGVRNWDFDPTKLQEYPRGQEIPEIESHGYDVKAPCAILRGDPKEIEDIVRATYACLGPASV